ncbi:YeeE/YedE family protein [Pseudogulbenkiania subflava]|uniref:Sulphur transport domain-containing protein n=1 Tax=Pseudogulbenkiania subflava DSM 22618 TaxID=1123014 RepID=A0A1Y6C0I8_9NEIS|nr:YeeE/YedE family protein [Pseudogulbenkiania subflava]SMF35584.1 hypothetical protein SAMN02745746_02730 [Pseudogulbenkiania subflava DSM 22618]
MKTLSALLAGLVFGLGLILSGMANPAKVQGFLDLAGAWDPSLALVMAGAIGAAFLPFRLAGQRKQSWLGEPLHLPGTREITPRLVLGSLLFGIGWGLAGLCPGPALVLLGTLSGPALVFVSAMLAGMELFRLLEHKRA